MQVTMPKGWQDPAYDVLEKDMAATSDFASLLKKMDAYLEAQRKTLEEKRKEEEEELQRKAREKQLMDLRLRITQLQSRVTAGYEGERRELEALKGQLLCMLMFG